MQNRINPGKNSPKLIVSPKIIRELRIAIGITRLFEIANLSELTLVAPIFHKRNPIPVEINPRNKRANKLLLVNSKTGVGKNR